MVKELSKWTDNHLFAINVDTLGVRECEREREIETGNWLGNTSFKIDPDTTTATVDEVDGDDDADGGREQGSGKQLSTGRELVIQ